MFSRRSNDKNKKPATNISVLARSDYGNFFTKSVTQDFTKVVTTTTQADDGTVSRDDLYKGCNIKQTNVYQSMQNYANQNRIEKQLNNALQKPVDMGPGHSMLQRMGWTGGGLGRTGDGILEPIAPNATYVSGQSRNYGTGNMSGAAKRRFKRMCKANIPPEKAIHLCRKTLKDLKEEVQKIDQGIIEDDSVNVKNNTQKQCELVEPSQDKGLNCGPKDNPRDLQLQNDERRRKEFSASCVKSSHSQNPQSYGPRNRERQYGLQNGPYSPWERRGLQEYGPQLSLNLLPNLKNTYSKSRTPENNVETSNAQTKEAKRPIRVGIYNYRMMNEDERNSVHRALNKAILKIGAKGIGPRFLSLDHKPGWVQIVCEDEHSRDWLFDEVPKLIPWPDAVLHVREEKVLEESVVVYIPQYEAQSIDEAINLLAVQNEGLNTESWEVIKARTIGNGLAVAFIIDMKSLETLKKNGLKAVLGFKTIQFKINYDADPNSISLESLFDGVTDSLGINIGPNRSLEPDMQTNKYERRSVLQDQIEPFTRLDRDDRAYFPNPDALEHETRPYYQDSLPRNGRSKPYTGGYRPPEYDETYYDPPNYPESYSRYYENPGGYNDYYGNYEDSYRNNFSRGFNEPEWDHIQEDSPVDNELRGSFSPRRNYRQSFQNNPKRESFRGRNVRPSNNYDRSGTLRRGKSKRTGLPGRGSFRNM
ncbi:unnamed protein product [Colias eurytheme]|nr:unnamed protein product [Colias eurytheme]